MTIYTLFSGSRGNAIFVRSGENCILVDAGCSCRAISQALERIGQSLCDIRAIFITHEHSDHIKALPILLKKHPIPVHVSTGTADALKMAGIDSTCIFAHAPCETVVIGESKDALSVTSFATPHDSRMSVGYRITARENGVTETAAIATDIGHITDEIRRGVTGVTSLILEANHDENMLLMGPYPYELKRRILSDHGHLSNSACGELLAQLIESGTKHILLAHLSEENNTPELAFLTVKQTLGLRGYTLTEDYTLAVAKKDEPVQLC